MNKDIERRQWMDLIIEHKPYKYMVTVTFKYSLNDNEAIQYFNRFINFANRAIYGGRGYIKNRHMTGFVFAERQQRRLTKQEIMQNKYKANNVEFLNSYGVKAAKQTKRSFNKEATLHFHMLIKDDLYLSRFSTTELRAVLLDSCMKVKKQSARRHDYEVFDDRGIDIRKVYDAEGLADYLTKDMKYVGSNNISPLSKQGVCFIAEDLKRSA